MMLKIKHTFSKDSFRLIKRIVLTQIFFGLIFPVAGFFIDEQSMQNKLMLFRVLSAEVFVTLVVILVDVVAIVIIFFHWQKETFKPKKSLKSVITALIKNGESKKVELKETLRWDIKENKINRDLEKVVLKTICGFLNSYGGTLIIGVNDKKEITGLTRDYVTLPKKNSDGFQNHLIQLVKQAIGITHLHNIDIGFEKLGGAEVCFLKIKKSDSPVFVRWNNEDEFYVRNGNSTNPIGIKEALVYIDTHWKEVEDTKNKSFLKRLF